MYFNRKNWEFFWYSVTSVALSICVLPFSMKQDHKGRCIARMTDLKAEQHCIYKLYCQKNHTLTTNKDTDMRKKFTLLKLLLLLWQRKVVWQVVKCYYPICKIYTWIYTLHHQHSYVGRQSSMHYNSQECMQIDKTKAKKIPTTQQRTQLGQSCCC